MRIKRNILWKLYIVILFTTELISFNIYGNLRLYYIVNVFVLFLFSRLIGKALSKKVLFSLILFVLSLLFTSVFSDSMIGSIRSVISLNFNIMIAFTIYLILSQKKITINEFYDLIEKVFLVNVVYGIVSLLLYRVAGINISLNPGTAFQIKGFQIPGLRTEANTHGKICCYAVAYCFPFLIMNRMDKQKKFLLYLSLLTLVVSPTRSATYALLIAIFCFLIYLMAKGYSGKVVKILFVILTVFGLASVLISSGIVKIEGYSLTKLNSFFITSKEAAMQDYSGAFRMESLMAAFDIWTQSLKTFLLGVGYNQAVVVLQNNTVKTVASGVEAMGLLVGGGLLSLLTLIIAVFTAIKAVYFMLNRSTSRNQCVLSSLFICLIFSFSMSCISGSFYVPETWMTFGIIAYYSETYYLLEES